MKTESLFQVLGLGLRAAEVFFSRRQPAAPKPDSRADRLVKRVVPAAGRALARVAPQSRKRRRRASTLGLASSTVVGAAAAGAAAYVVTRQQQVLRDRYQPIHAAFRVELLDLLSAPGGAGRLEYLGDRLTDPHTGAAYNVVDGIPDFIAPFGEAAEQLPAMPDGLAQMGWLAELARLGAMEVLGRNGAGNAAFASAAAASASTGWVLSVPAGRGIYELEMARANPRAHVLCVGGEWDNLLEVRRRALEAGLSNVYFARGLPRLLPLQDRSVAGVWTAGGLDRFPEPERELTQMARVARRGALMAGVSLVRGGANVYDVVLQFGVQRLPGTRSQVAHFALLQAAGLQDVRLFRDGAFVRFTGVRS